MASLLGFFATKFLKPALQNVASKLIPFAAKKVAKWTGIKSI
jgi:hypothetical protein